MRRDRLAVCAALVLVFAAALAATGPAAASAQPDRGDAGAALVAAAPAGETTASQSVRPSRDREFDSEARAAIYDVVRSLPGVHFARAAEDAGLETSTARYHVRVLERDGVVDSEHVLGKKRLFPSDRDADRAADAAAVDPTTRAVLAAVDRTDPATVNAVAAALDRAPSTVSEHLDRLDDAGVLDRERDGGSVVARLSPAAEGRLP
ncbi:winged helix-turn-helix transcriptional regulator [Halobacterium yunchengense]|uniref:winged helix-turn-helix transcriptional regulator n=1 Tax=Halobacterium yunchengense TaxID=3108497 RepID=UPI003007F88A